MSKPKIVVLHMRELIYTAIFAFLILVLLILLFLMFRPQNSSDTPISETETGLSSSNTATEKYHAGIYTTSLILNDHYADIEVALNTDQIDHIRLINLGDSVTTALPLVEPSLDELSLQICQKQSLDGITCSRENKYTSELLFQAIKNSLAKAQR